MAGGGSANACVSVAPFSSSSVAPSSSGDSRQTRRHASRRPSVNCHATSLITAPFSSNQSMSCSPSPRSLFASMK